MGEWCIVLAPVSRSSLSSLSHLSPESISAGSPILLREKEGDVGSPLGRKKMGNTCISMQYHTAHNTHHSTRHSTQHKAQRTRHTAQHTAHSTQHTAHSTHLGSRSTAPLPSNDRLIIEDGIDPGSDVSISRHAFSSTKGSSLGEFPIASSLRDFMPALRRAAASWETKVFKEEKGEGGEEGRGRRKWTRWVNRSHTHG